MNDSGQWGNKFLEFMLSNEVLDLYKERGLQAASSS